MKPERFSNCPSGQLVQASTQTRDGLVRYHAFIPDSLPPALALDIDFVRTLSNADRALGELAGLGNSMPTVQLLISAFIRREAVLSSRIEGSRTGIIDLYAYEAGQLQLPGMTQIPESDNQEVFNYVRALEHGLDRIRDTPVNLGLIRDLHNLLMENMEGARGMQIHRGEFRAIQNMIIGAANENLQTARFVPPPPLQMNQALHALEEYIQSEDTYPPLVRLSLIHYQFETIHPFEDGNGRIGRLLISLLLVHWKLLPLPLLDLSAYINRNKDAYCDLLLSVSERGTWVEWVKFFLRGVAEQAVDSATRTKLLLDLREEWRERLTQAHASALPLRLVDSLFKLPIITIPKARDMLDVTYVSAQRNIDKLVTTGIIEPAGKTPVGKAFVAREIIKIIRE